MGCDIHLYSETKRNGVWECDQADQATRETEDWGDGPFERLELPRMEGQSSRDYWFFGLLNNGVRANYDWSWEYKDVFPEDASDLLVELKKQEGEDAHSARFLTRAELHAKLEELKLKRAELLITDGGNGQACAHHVQRLTDLLADLTADVPVEDQRIVFWFDN